MTTALIEVVFAPQQSTVIEVSSLGVFEKSAALEWVDSVPVPDASVITVTLPPVMLSIAGAANLIGSDCFVAVDSALATEVIAAKAKAEHTRGTILITDFS